MRIENRKSFLELNVIWKDIHMIELQITASNVDFSGKTEAYFNSGDLSRFADSLIGYPRNRIELFYEAGSKESNTYFSMKYYSIEHSGYIGVGITIEKSKAWVKSREEQERSKIKLEIIVEPSALDNFHKELMHLIKYEEGTATLYGNDNRLDN